jgi:tRNA A37 threonylcarbamoyladenosine dehydratase
MERFSRTELLLGKEKIKKLHTARITVIGLGAVGSYATEALARSGVGYLRLIDFDTVQRSNINRQLYALESTVGKKKVLCAKERVLDINPHCHVDVLDLFVAEDTMDKVFQSRMDICIDAIDGVNAKVSLLKNAYERKIPILSSMGAAVRTDPSRIKRGDLFETKGCPLASYIRKRVRRCGVGPGIQCVYSDERVTFVPPEDDESGEESLQTRGRKRKKLGSLPTITAIFGLTLAHTAIGMICGGFDRETGNEKEIK